MKEVTLGLLGLGTVASGLVNALQAQASLLAERNNFKVKIKAVAVRDLKAKRDCKIDSALLTSDPFAVVNDPEVNIVVELIGGTTLASELVKTALQNGKAVVSANKALIAEQGAELFALAAKHETSLFFEAAVAGGIPIIKTLRESFAGNKVTSISGIMNGTCNYILTRMQENDKFFDEALQFITMAGHFSN